MMKLKGIGLGLTVGVYLITKNWDLIGFERVSQMWMVNLQHTLREDNATADFIVTIT